MHTEKKLILADFMPFRLSITSNRVSDAVATVYSVAFDLGIPEWRLIAVVAEAQQISQLDICRRTRMDKVTVSRAAAVLVAKKLLKRKRNLDDQRSHFVALSGAGRRLYGQIVPKALEIQDQIFRGFTAAELRIFSGLLNRVETAALGLEPGSQDRSLKAADDVSPADPPHDHKK